MRASSPSKHSLNRDGSPLKRFAVCWWGLFPAAHLKERLEDYIKQWNGLVKLFRNERREGLIQARSIGARKASVGQVRSPRAHLHTCIVCVCERFPCEKIVCRSMPGV